MREDKVDLLNSFDEVARQKGELSTGDLLIVLLVTIIVLALAIPKIYVANEIYYKSRTINKLLDDYEILKEENRLLRQQLEKLRFKTQVLDTIF